MNDSETVRQLAVRDLADAGLNTDGLTVRPIAGGISGASYRVELAGRTVFLKRYGAGGAAAGEEFDALTRARQMCKKARFACPLAVNREAGHLYLDWIAGKDLRTFSQGPWGTPSAFRNVLAQAGRWLADLHEASEPRFEPMDTSDRLGIIKRQDADGVLSGIEPYRSAWSLLQESATALAGHEVPWALAHGDFKIDNLMVVDGELVGVDLALKYRIPVYYDLTNFISNLATHIMKTLSLPLRVQQRRLRESFLEGYQHASGWQVSRPVLAWCRLGAALTHAGRDGREGAAGIRGALNGRWVRRRRDALIVTLRG